MMHKRDWFHEREEITMHKTFHRCLALLATAAVLSWSTAVAKSVAAAKVAQDYHWRRMHTVQRRGTIGGCFSVEDVNEKAGFEPYDARNYSVAFLNNSGNYYIKVTWKTPKGLNKSVLTGYIFAWRVVRDSRADEENSEFCYVLTPENTSFVVHESQYWKRYEKISFALKPLPSTKGGVLKFQPKIPAYTDVPTSRSSAPKATKITAFDQSTHSSSSYPEFTRSTDGTLSEVRSDKPNKDSRKTLFTILSAAFAVIASVSILIVFVALRKKKPNKQSKRISCKDPGHIYVSYSPDNSEITAEIVEFTTWFQKQGYDVQMDVMLTPNMQLELKELGRVRFSQKQLSQADNVFLILSPSYLKLCRLDEGESDAAKFSQQEKIAFSEITQIRNELCSKAYFSSRFIPVLFGVQETELPFWIKQLVVYSWLEDKLNNKLLYRLNEEVGYQNEEMSEES